MCDAHVPDPGRRRFLTAVGLGAAGVLAGCSGGTVGQLDRPPETFDPPALPYDETYPHDEPVTMFRRGLRRLGYYPDATVPEAVAVSWAMPINYFGHTAAKASPRPTPAGDGLVIPADTGRVHAVSPMGEHRWTHRTEAVHYGIHGTPTVVDDVAYVGGYDGNLYALDVATGTEVWRLRSETIGGPTAIGSSPAYLDGVLYFLAEYLSPPSGALWAVDAAEGRPLWSDQRPEGMPHPSPAIDPVAGRLVGGSNDGVVYAWAFPSLEFAWSFQTGGEVKGTPPVYDGKTYAGSWDGNVYCLDLADGTERWRFETDEVIMSNPGVDPGSNTVFVGGDDTYVRALDADSGRLRWETSVNNYVIGSLTVTADAVLVGSYDTHLYALEKDTGAVRWAVPNNGHVTSEPVPHRGRIYYAERANIDNYWTPDEVAVVRAPGHAYCLAERP